MTSDEIRQLDGPALAALAFSMGLAPSGTRQWYDGSNQYYDDDAEAAWRPFSRLGQADTVFRQVRQHGWTTSNQYYTPLAYGECRIRKETEHGGIVFLEEYTLSAQEEALALLRVACLAIASERMDREREKESL